MSQAIMSLDSLSNNFEIGMIEYNSYTKVILANLPKNSLLGQGQFGPNLGQNYATLSHDSLSEYVFEFLCLDETQ